MGCYLGRQKFNDALEFLLTNCQDEVERAVDAANHHILGQFAPVNSMAGGRWTSLGTPIDWSFNPTNDPEFTWLINRFWHLRDLGIAWKYTKDKKFVEAYKSHIEGWIEQNPVPWEDSWADATHYQRIGPWRLLETGLRAESLVTSWQFFEECFVGNDEFKNKFMSTLADHADWLSMRLGSVEINHAMMHMLGLYAISAMLPEHPKSSLWSQIAIERYGLCLYRQVGDDGVHQELTPGYHNVSVELFVKPCIISKNTGKSLPEWFKTRVKKMACFSEATLRSDGKTSAISDWEADYSGRVALAQLGLLFEDDEFIKQGVWSPELLWMFGTDSLKKINPDKNNFKQSSKSISFPQSGYYIMRNETNSVLFDAASMGGAHGHADALSFEWTNGNTPIVCDPGRFTYEEGELRRWFKSTRAHSTVEIDHLDQSTYVSTQAWSEPTANVVVDEWISNELFDLCSASHDGYHRLSQPVSHKRKLAFLKDRDTLIIIDQIKGRGVHAFSQRLVFSPCFDLNISEESNSSLCGCITHDDINYKIYAAFDGKFQKRPVPVKEKSWISEKYSRRIETSAFNLTGEFIDECLIMTVVKKNNEIQAINNPSLTVNFENDSAVVSYVNEGKEFFIEDISALWRNIETAPVG